MIPSDKKYIENMMKYVENVKQYDLRLGKILESPSYRLWDLEKFRILLLYGRLGLGRIQSFPLHVYSETCEILGSLLNVYSREYVGNNIGRGTWTNSELL